MFKKEIFQNNVDIKGMEAIKAYFKSENFKGVRIGCTGTIDKNISGNRHENIKR